jgi:hypothetical protein
MTMAHRKTSILTIEEVQARFEKWRRNRQGHEAIPDELWAAAVEIAQWNGVNRTAAALHLDGGKLKKQMVAAGAVSKMPVQPNFVELISPLSNSAPEYVIELEGRNGTMRIHCKGTTAAELIDLSRTLWSAER